MLLRVRVADGKFCELQPAQWRETGRESVLEAGECQALNDFAGDVPLTIHGPDFTALVGNVLFLESVEQVAIEAWLPVQSVFLIECGLERVRFERLPRAHRRAFEHDDKLFSVDPFLRGD